MPGGAAMHDPLALALANDETLGTFETTRVSISWGGRPPTLKITLMTGMSIVGKMSVGIRRIDTTPPMTISIAITMKV